MKFIDAIGLKYFYDKLKDKFVQKSTKVSKENIDIYGITSYADLYKMFVSIGDENVPAIIAADNTSSPKYFIMSMYNNTPSDEDNGLHVNKCCIMQICSNTEDGKIKSLSFKDDGIFTMTDNVVGKNTELFAANGTLFDITTKLDVTGGKVQGNLYADPEHCTDIADYTDTEKAILTNNTVQKNILELNKTKTFVDSIKVNDNSIKLSEKNTTTNITYENYINPTGIFFRSLTTVGSLGTRVNTLLKINNKGIALYNGSATEVFATNGKTFDMNTKADAFTEIPSSSWKTSTPFNILDGVVTNIYKGETVGNYTKWILIPYADSENQKYTAYKKGNAKYIYSQYDFDLNQPLLPWEFWLPSNLAVNTVEVDW